MIPGKAPRIARALAAAVCAGVLALSLPVAGWAIESDPIDELAAANPDFVNARKAIESRDWQAAIRLLTASDRRTPGNAEIHNLLGYAYRNAGQVDVALEHYDRALKIDPRHRGAHEYIGEAYLMIDEPARAERHLAILKDLCERVCEERDDLARKIAAWRSRKR